MSAWSKCYFTTETIICRIIFFYLDTARRWLELLGCQPTTTSAVWVSLMKRKFQVKLACLSEILSGASCKTWNLESRITQIPKLSPTLYFDCFSKAEINLSIDKVVSEVLKSKIQYPLSFSFDIRLESTGACAIIHTPFEWDRYLRLHYGATWQWTVHRKTHQTSDESLC